MSKIKCETSVNKVLVLVCTDILNIYVHFVLLKYGI